MTSTFEPLAIRSRERASTSANSVTSHDPDASVMRTQAIRLPVRVTRSFCAATMPARRTRVMPACALVSTCAHGVVPSRRSALA